jgi:hypothetical protein
MNPSTETVKNGARAVQSFPEQVKPPEKRPIDWRGEIDVTTLTLPQMMAHTGGFGLVVGMSFAGGGNLSGIVRRITIMPQGFVRVIIELGADPYRGGTQRYGAFIFFGNGMYSEIDTCVHEAVTEENSGPWQPGLQDVQR